MLGPLPTLHRVVVALSIVALSASIGAWLDASPEVPVFAPVATGAAGVLGIVLAWLAVRVRDHGRTSAG